MTLQIPRLRLSNQPKHDRILAKNIDKNPYNVPIAYKDFLSECCRIRSGNKVIPFIPFDYQVELSRLIDQHRGVVIFKTRQMGITECLAAKFLHKALLNPAYASVVLSMGQSESSNVAVRIQNMPSKIPNLRFSTKSKTEVQPEGCGKIWFRPSTDNAARSLESVSDILIDEFAFIDNSEELYASAAPTQEAVGDDARTIIASTMSEDGKLSVFWQMFAADNQCDAEEMVERVKDGREEPFVYWIDKAGWAKVLIHWKSHPIYSSVPDFLEKTKREKKLSQSKLEREYNLGLPSSAGSLFDSRAVDRCATGAYSDRTYGNLYLCCIDPNFGGSDYWVTQIWDVTEMPYSLVAQYRASEQSTTYSYDKSIILMDTYCPQLIAVESNGGGAVIAEKLAQDRPTYRVEVTRTTATSKRTMTDRIAIAVEEGEVIYPPEWEGVLEMKNFSAVKREASTGNDDCLMAWAIGWAWLDEVAQQRVYDYSSAFGVEYR